MGVAFWFSALSHVWALHRPHVDRHLFVCGIRRGVAPPAWQQRATDIVFAGLQNATAPVISGINLFKKVDIVVRVKHARHFSKLRRMRSVAVHLLVKAVA